MKGNGHSPDETSCAASRRVQASLPVPTGGWRCQVAIAALVAAASPLSADTVSVSVFELFRPRELTVASTPGTHLKIFVAGKTFALEGRQNASLRNHDAFVEVSAGGETILGTAVRATPSGGAGRFVLAVPGRIRREFPGELRVSVRGDYLLGVVEMDLESAVAAIVAAEGGDAPPEALAAQAVAARSYLTSAAGRHAGFQFCDTTHCQYLAGPPPIGSEALRAALRTKGLVLSYRGTRFAPLYSRSCGGTTHAPSDVGLVDGAYSYQRVRCPVCSKEGTSWATDRPASDVAAIISRPGNEMARLDVVRNLGWSSVPSNRYEISRRGEQVRIEGAGEGHGVGLCQRGAIGLALRGWSFREILSFYLPDSTLAERPAK